MKSKIYLYTFVLSTLLLCGCTRNDTQGTQHISEEDAKQIVLSHAGLTSDQVTFIKSELDSDSSRLNYDVEFYTNDNKEYDYELDPYTGAVLEWDVDMIYDGNS